MINRFSILITLVFLLLGCQTMDSENTKINRDNYFQYYNLEILEGKRESVFLENRAGSIWTWSVTPENYSKTVVFIHGYLDHSALQQMPLEFLNGLNYRIILLDLPGHGLSDGERGGLEHMDQYRDALDLVVSFWGLEWEDTIFIGHSLGGAIILDRLLEGQAIRGAVLGAPLVNFWHFDLALYLTTKVYKDGMTIRARKIKCTSNTEFNEKKYSDPLYIKRIPLNWVLAIANWCTKLPEEEIPCSVPILVLQGEKDHVVDYRRNIPQILSWFPHAEVLYYSDYRHHIYNEMSTEGMYQELALWLKEL
jgi:alpha-beta hydrolase superfamily lysophospholipase